MSRFKVSVTSSFEELWRYNIVLVCELCSAEGERVDFLSKDSTIAPVGSNMTAPPIDYDTNRKICCECGEGDHLNILLYIIPHTLPFTDDLYEIKSFPVVVRVEADKKVVLNQAFEINQWSGDNIALKRVGAEV